MPPARLRDLRAAGGRVAARTGRRAANPPRRREVRGASELVGAFSAALAEGAALRGGGVGVSEQEDLWSVVLRIWGSG